MAARLMAFIAQDGNIWNIDFIFDLTNFASSFVVFDGVV
jgi:hypothetical protein